MQITQEPIHDNPVVEQKALALAASYHALASARESGGAKLADVAVLEKTVNTARESLFSQAKATNIRLFPAPTNVGFRTDHHEGELVSGDKPSFNDPAAFAKRLEGERSLKAWLNDYIAAIAAKHHYTLPENNAYFGIGNSRGT